VMAANRFANNSVFSFFNPAINSALTINFAQPLLRNRGWFVNRAPIVIAQRNLKQSHANFAAQVNDSISRVVNEYWDVVQARQSMVVLQKSLELAEATYKQNKRALELGALPPLDIYRSESQVAQRKLQLIQNDYQLRQTEDEFRRTIGADLDLRIAALDLDLTEPAEPLGTLREVDLKDAIEKAMQSRPELESLSLDIANADTSLRVATNALKPDLSLTTFYTMNGRGGNEIDSTTGVIIGRSGLVDSFDQLSSRDYPAYGMGLTLRLPLKNRSAEADLGTALASQRRSLYQQRQRQQAIVQDVRNAANQLEQAKLSIAAAKLNRDLSQKNLEAEQRKYELGAEPIFFVLDAQTQLAQAEQSLVQAEIGYQRAITAVDHATGELLAHHRVQLSALNP
jgi:outer membrane protein